MWPCPNCGEQIDDAFDACWKCGTAQDGTLAVDFQAEPSDSAAPSSRPEPEPANQIVSHSIDKIALVLALAAWVAVSLGVILLSAYGFYSAAFPVFLALIWIGFPCSLVGLLMGAHAAIKRGSRIGIAAVALCVLLYVAWIELVLSQSH